MRKVYDPKIVEKDGRVIGLSFGADFCAEHEWGIKEIFKKFGISNSVSELGEDRYKVSKIPETLEWVEENGLTGIVFLPSKTEMERFSAKQLISYSSKTIEAAWDSESFAFCCLASDTNMVRKLKEIFDHLRAKDAIICLSGGTALFENSGLSILISSKIPQDIKDSWKNKHLQDKAIEKEWKKLTPGLLKKLKKSNKNWFFLGGEKGSGGLMRDKNGRLLAWLNPMEQNTYNYGYFSPKDLYDWAEDKGPIMMKKEN
jgi:hypothetical protein